MYSSHIFTPVIAESDPSADDWLQSSPPADQSPGDSDQSPPRNQQRHFLAAQTLIQYRYQHNSLLSSRVPVHVPYMTAFECGGTGTSAPDSRQL